MERPEPGHRTVCHVERDSFAAATLVARMADKALDHAPVWDNVVSFDGRPWRGKVDIITAGYPCQPFSAAGKQLGAADRRHLWPHVRRVIGEVRPRRVFCENVEGHLHLGFAEVAGALQDMGYHVRAGVFSTAETGASHQRRRLFILADTDIPQRGQPGRVQAGGEPLDDAARHQAARQSGQSVHRGALVDDVLAAVSGTGTEAGRAGDDLPLFAPAPCDMSAWFAALSRHPGLQPCLYGLDHGLADWLDRPAAAGNGVSPLAAALAWRVLNDGLEGI